MQPDQPRAHGRPPTSAGLRDEPPGATGIGVAAGIGGLWGLIGYSILWEGSPVEVDRAFVVSGVGTALLLPVRIAIWGIHLAESAAGRSFDFSSNHWWIALLAGAIGTVIATGAFLALRAGFRRAHRPPGRALPG
jgi:hypothetical protein